MNFLLSIFLFLIPFNEKPISNEIYCNARFDFCVEYPTTLFGEKLTPTNADGVLLRSDDRNISLAIYGEYNIFANTLVEQQELIFKALTETDGPIISHLTVFTEEGFVSTIEFATHKAELHCQKKDLYFVNTLIRVKDDTDLSDIQVRIELNLES
jgi:hypothetical protein